MLNIDLYKPICSSIAITGIAAWVGDASWLSLESDFSKGSFVTPAVAFRTSPACSDFSLRGVTGDAGPDAKRSGDPSSWVLSCLGPFVLMQEMLAVGHDGFGLSSSPGVLGEAA